MTSPIRRALAAGGFACILSLTLACRHKAVTDSVPTTAPTPAQLAAMEPDQVNTAGWDKAWTNLLNDPEESFTPSASKLQGVEVELVVGNPGESEDELTLTILDAHGQGVVAVTQKVQGENCDHEMFVMPSGGIEIMPGGVYWIRLTGGSTFGWKYVVDGYENGQATINGKPLLAQARSTFLFRTFGEK